MVISQLRQHRVLAIIRTATMDGAIALAEKHPLSEISLITPDALHAIECLRERFIGAGTVLSGLDVRNAVAAGARFLVTPAVLPEVQKEADRLGVPVLMGASTPTEVLTAHRLGAAAIKLFPSGGVAHLKALRGPFPDILFVPVGGIKLAEVQSYLDAGALAVGLGSALHV